METIHLLQIIWYFIIGILFIGYAILDGFDLGVGSLYPFLAKSEEERKRLFDIIWPFWDGNEVWLITGGAALFAAFPNAYATVFSGFYLALMLVLFSLIFRAVSIEFWYYDEKRRGLWGWAFFLGSLIPSLLFGVALGNVIIGVPLDNAMDFTGNFFTLLRPYPLALGLLGLSAILMQGATYTALKTDGALRERARNMSKTAGICFIATLAVSFIATVLYLPDSLKNIFIWISAAVVILAWLFHRASLGRGKDATAFVMSSLAFAGLWGIAGATHFPNLVRAGNDPSFSITLTNASSGELTLKIMLGIVVVGMPVVLAYTVYVYRVLRKSYR